MNFFYALAEKFLDSDDGTPNFGLSLLQLLTQDGADDVVRVAAAVTFKNFVKKNWRMVWFFKLKISLYYWQKRFFFT